MSSLSVAVFNGNDEDADFKFSEIEPIEDDADLDDDSNELTLVIVDEEFIDDHSKRKLLTLDMDDVMGRLRLRLQKILSDLDEFVEERIASSRIEFKMYEEEQRKKDCQQISN